MEAARVAALRGHEIVLFEREPQLGGNIRIASKAPGWEAYANSIQGLERQIRKLPIEIRLNSNATEASILEGAPEAIVIATGAAARRPYLPGNDLPHTVTAADVLAGRMKLGRRVVILDETGKVVSANATSGPQILRDAAVQAALKARFSPTKLSGQPVKVSGVINYKFALVP